jgi:hypothetical protein
VFRRSRRTDRAAYDVAQLIRFDPFRLVDPEPRAKRERPSNGAK